MATSFVFRLPQKIAVGVHARLFGGKWFGNVRRRTL
jgi:hypothetical protein